MNETPEISFHDLLDSAPVGILIFNENFLIKYVNQSFFSFQATSKFDKVEILNEDILRINIFKKDISDQLLKLNDGEDFETELFTLHSSNGSELSIKVKATSIFADNEFKGGVLILEDVKLPANEKNRDINIQDRTLNLLSGMTDKFFLTNRFGEIKYSSSFDNLSFVKDIKHIDEIFDSTSLKGIKNLFDKITVIQKKVEADLPVIINNNDIIVNVKLIPFVIQDNEISLIAVLIKNVTEELEEKINYENELSELRRYQVITSAIVDSVIGLNLKGEIRFWNESSEKLFGLSKSSVYNKFIDKIFPSVNTEYFEILKNELKRTKTWEGEFSTNLGSDEEEFYKVRAGLIGDEQNESIVLLCSRITERANIEKELRQSEERFRNIVTNTHEYICTLDTEGNITYVNPYFSSRFQFTDEELLSLNFKDLIEPEFLEKNNFKIDPEKLSSFEAVEITLCKKDGTRIYVLAGFSSVKDFNNKPKYYNAVLTDITEKKQAEKDLLLIQTVFQASQDGIAVTVDNKIVLVNKSFVEMTGFNDEAELNGKNILEIINDNHKTRVEKTLSLIEKGDRSSERFEFEIVTLDGRRISVENSAATYKIEDAVYLVSVLRDNTEEKLRQQKLIESEERYRSITENINECLWAVEKRNGKLDIVLYTPVVKDITGFSSEQFLNNKFLWFRIIHPNDVNAVVARMKRLFNDPARYSETFEYRIINQLGNTIWIENKINILRDANGSINKIYGLVSDITLNKKAEDELKKAADNFKELNDTKDRFLSIVSHDLRTPFSSILGFTDFLLSEKDIPEDKRIQYIEMIRDSSRNMLSLVNSLLDWTRLQTGRIKFEPQRINAKNIIDGSIEIMSGVAMKKSINLFSMLEGDIFVHADESLLMQVFNNLISNAIKFTKEGGDISVNVFPRIDQRAIEFSVNDNGVGIDAEDQQKLFKVETKYTTPGTSGERGSGLGLSLVHDIVKMHGGEIRVESEPGRGTRIYFTIPIASMNILLVDDSRKERLLYSKIIKSFLPNHNIWEAANGKEAYSLIQSSPPALIITDHNMPEMTGYEFVKQLKFSDLKFKPPVIILSSDINEAIEEEYSELGMEYVFRKPVNLNSLKQAIDNSLKKSIYT